MDQWELDGLMSRRRFVGLSGAGAAVVVFGSASSLLPTATGTPGFPSDPFSLGVASGVPRADGVVLWTRLAPDPLRGGGMPERAVPPPTATWPRSLDVVFHVGDYIYEYGPREYPSPSGVART